MTESGYVWIVTEQALNANNTPDGVIGLQLVHAKSEKNHIRVSMHIYLCKWTLKKTDLFACPFFCCCCSDGIFFAQNQSGDPQTDWKMN